MTFVRECIYHLASEALEGLGAQNIFDHARQSYVDAFEYMMPKDSFDGRPLRLVKSRHIVSEVWKKPDHNPIFKGPSARYVVKFGKDPRP